jgi:DNA-binding response OmpR family regulator
VNPDKERKHILLVEDYEDARAIVKYCLAEYKFSCAHDIGEGLRLARRGYFDLYILDNWLPDGSGVELCRHIREFDPHTPILFYTAAGHTSDINEALRVGAQACLLKPVRFEALKQAVAQLIAFAGETEIEARMAELIAIREELAVQKVEYAELIERAKKKRLRAKEKVIRLKAEKAFLTAGGSRGEFARRWPSVFREEVRSRRHIG